MNLSEFLSYFFTGIVIWLILFIISCVFLCQSAKRKNFIQIIIYPVLIFFIGYTIVARLNDYFTSSRTIITSGL